MNKYIYLSDKDTSSQIFRDYTDEIFKKLYFLKRSYPNFKDWYYNKVVPDIQYGRREIIINKTDGHISAVSILKKSEEKKICTFVVFPKYQNRGIGKEMLQKSMKFLDTKKPIITVSSENIDSFRHLLNEFNFTKYDEIKNCYKNRSSEYVFNGYLNIKECYKSA
ncbi:MAG TPA: GNAT family N-acetyltransferase [Clostridium sp.]|uniref:GNAT family N-acetyltransferase n=1 Tax=Clostridium sp. TaxID=1506 RepID=UPI002F94D126